MNTPRTALEELLAFTYPHSSKFNSAAGRFVRSHGKALSEALGGWLPIDKFGTSADCVLLYNPSLENDEFPGHSFTVSNCLYAKLQAKKDGYTHWKPITPPTSAKGDKP